MTELSETKKNIDLLRNILEIIPKIGQKIEIISNLF